MCADVPCEVDVEVVRHAYRREGSLTPTEGPLRTIQSYIRHLHHSSEGAPKSTEQEQARDSTKLDVTPTGAEEPITNGLPTEEAAAVTHTETDQNDEEEWASEDSDERTIASVSTARAPSERRKRVRSSKGKAVMKPAGLNKKGRRRSSVSEHTRSSLHVRSRSADTTSPLTSEPERISEIPEDADPRGRSTRPERKNSGFSPQPSIQHRRLESLRQAGHSRDASPSRSIRFADEHPSGTSTPRNGILQNESWSPIN